MGVFQLLNAASLYASECIQCGYLLWSIESRDGGSLIVAQLLLRMYEMLLFFPPTRNPTDERGCMLKSMVSPGDPCDLWDCEDFVRIDPIAV